MVRSGSSPHGQGHDTTFAQLAAERLGVASRPWSFASATARRCRAVSARSAVRRDGGSAISGGRRRPARRGRAQGTVRFESDLVFFSGAYAAVVEISEETGSLTVLRVAAVDDAGTIVNPLLAEGQVDGGIAHGPRHEPRRAGRLRRGGPPDVRLVHRLRPADRRGDAADRHRVRRVAVAAEPPRREGHRGGGHDRYTGRRGERGRRRTGGVRVDPPFTDEKLWRALRA